VVVFAFLLRVGFGDRSSSVALGAVARARVSNLAFFGWIGREDLCVE
jgi:hypothetical protein